MDYHAFLTKIQEVIIETISNQLNISHKPKRRIIRRKNPDHLLNENQAAEYLGLVKGTLTVWRHLGKGPGWIKLGSAVRYKLSALQDYIKSNSVKAEGK